MWQLGARRWMFCGLVWVGHPSFTPTCLWLTPGHGSSNFCGGGGLYTSCPRPASLFSSLIARQNRTWRPGPVFEERQEHHKPVTHPRPSPLQFFNITGGPRKTRQTLHSYTTLACGDTQAESQILGTFAHGTHAHRAWPRLARGMPLFRLRVRGNLPWG